MDSKICGKCKQLKAIALFGRDATRVDGFNYFCKGCSKRTSANHYSNKSDKLKEQHAAYYGRTKKEFPERYVQYQRTRYYKDHSHSLKQARKHRLSGQYGITVEQYDAMLIQQNHMCKTCDTKITETNKALDHCHTTNKVRGILCRDCNIALGLVKDNPSTLSKMIGYLQATQGINTEHSNFAE